VSDVFDQSFGDEPAPVDGIEGLDAMEIDPEDEMQRHLQEIREALSEQVSAAMVSEINRQLEMSHGTPGAYEAALFDAFVSVMREEGESYDRIVFDTAPTGSTLRLLGLPEFLGDWIDRLLYKRKQSIDLFEKAAIGDMEPRRLMDGDPVLERLQRRKEFFEFAGDTMRDEAAFFLVLNPPTSSRSTRQDGRSRGSPSATCASVGSSRTSLPRSPTTTTRGTRSHLPPREGRDRARPAPAGPRGVRAPLVAEIESRTREVRGDVLAEVARRARHRDGERRERGGRRPHPK